MPEACDSRYPCSVGLRVIGAFPVLCAEASLASNDDFRRLAMKWRMVFPSAIRAALAKERFSAQIETNFKRPAGNALGNEEVLPMLKLYV
jgi:hypothetical protein